MATKTKKKLTKKQKTNILIIISVVFLAITAVALIMATHASPTPNPLQSLNKDVAQGIDVSHHNGRIKWDKVADEYDFAFIRVGYSGYVTGEHNKDRRAIRNLSQASKAGIPIGVYYYSQAITPEEAEEEAKYALKIAKGYDISLPIVIDYEYATNDNGKLCGRLFDAHLSKKDATKTINAFCKEIKKAGYTPGVYASSSFFKNEFDSKSITKSAVIWVADYNDSVTYRGKYDIWQYSNKGRANGVKSKNVDKNYWYIK